MARPNKLDMASLWNAGGLWQLLQRQACHSRMESFGHRRNADTLLPLTDLSISQWVVVASEPLFLQDRVRKTDVYQSAVYLMPHQTVCSSARTLRWASLGTFSAPLQSWCSCICVSQSGLPCSG